MLVAGILFGMTGCGEKKDSSTSDKNKETYNRNNISEATVGDYVVFGSYEQDNNLKNGKEQIEWIVLDEKDGKKLLISRYILDAGRYSNESFQEWRTCSLRTWLNGDFYEEAFSEKDKKYMASSSLNNPDNKYYEDLAETYETVDVIFLLGAEEAEKYKSARTTEWILTEEVFPTAYAEANGLRLLEMDEQKAFYWCLLRSAGHYPACAALINTSGKIDRGGVSVTEEGFGIRPVLWVYEEEQEKAPIYVLAEKQEEGNFDNNSGNFVADENGQQEDENQEIGKNPSQQEQTKEFRYMMFGSYEQDNNTDNGKEEIEWIVLEEENGEVLLLSRYILDVNQMESYYNIWEKRLLRTWLNEEFYNNAFSEEEKGKLVNLRVMNPDNDGYIVSAGATYEYVSLLSVNEAKRYFGEDDSIYGNSGLATCATEYAIAQGIKVNEFQDGGEGNSHWDLRSNGYHQGYVAWVSDRGKIISGGHAQPEGAGIRPMIKVRYVDDDEFDEIVFENATRYFEAGEYEKAEECFAKLIDTQNVSEEINECRYMRAKQLFSSGEFGKAKMLFSQIQSYKDAKQLMETAGNEELKRIVVGESYWMGRYEQDDNVDNGAEPIEWQVLEIKEDKILLISKYVLDAMMFDDGRSVWEHSFMREWLNEEFYNSSFTEEEKARISETTLKNSDSYLEPNDVSADTVDKVFLLSANEVVQYFGEEVGFENPSRTAAPTAYAIARGVNINAADENDVKCWWHLRSNGVHEGLVLEINLWGQMIDINKDRSDRGVRPVIWITKE